MHHSESNTREKVSDTTAFGPIVDAGARVAAPRRAPPVAADPVAKLAKATGPHARAVAEVVEGRVARNDKTSVVRAQVVKVGPGIMDKSRLHLQDGSGSPPAAATTSS